MKRFNSLRTGRHIQTLSIFAIFALTFVSIPYEREGTFRHN